MATKLKFGYCCPHFCEYGSTEMCIEGSKKAEAYGFDSVWVRDHLVFEPHGMEGEDNTHIEGLLILAAIAPLCKKLTLGTGTMISHRHPIHLAQSMAGLSTLCDSNIIMGLASAPFPMNSKRQVTRRRPCKIAPTSPKSTLNSAAASGPAKISYKDDYYDFKDLAQTDAEENSDLVRRRHARFLPPRRGLLRRLDARTHSDGYF